jgi:hypothetical protein
MRKALLLSTLTFFVLGLTACNESNDVTGISGGKTAFATGREAQGNATALADPQHKVVVQAPNQRAPLPHKRGVTPTPTPTPNP